MNEQQKSQRGQEMPHYTEEEARAYFERMRWPDGPVCHHCRSKEVFLMDGNGHRPGLYHCRECRGQTTVTLGSVMVDSHLPLSTWAKAFHMMATNKKGVSALYLMRNLGLGSYRTAWHLAHRIREAMKGPMAADQSPLDGIIEIDETFVGGKARGHKNKMTNKSVVLSLVERGPKGRKRSKVVPDVTAKSLREAIQGQVADTAEIHTDELKAYQAFLPKERHDTVVHSYKQYSKKRKNPDGTRTTVTTNTVEASFALLKRGIMGQFHSVSKKHLHRYCTEFDARWTLRGLTDVERRDEIVKGAEGRRLTYKEPVAALAKGT